MMTYYTVEEDKNISATSDGFGFVKYINIYKRNYLDENMHTRIKRIDKSEYLDAESTVWKTDGTEEGTIMLTQIYHTGHRYESSNAKFINYSNGKLRILNYHEGLNIGR